MSEATDGGKQTAYTPGMDRRKRKPDAWLRVLRYVTVLVYPILIINFLIFLALTGEEQKQAIAGQMGSASVQRVSAWVNLHAFLPIMLAGLAVSAAGLFLSRKRARRRYDYKFQNQLILIVLSVCGLFIYLLVIRTPGG